MKSKQIIYAALVVFLFVSFFFVSKQIEAPKNSSTSQPASSQQTKTFDLVIKNRKLVSGPETVQIIQGDKVSLNITVDETEELHVHGYDKSIELEKDTKATLSFTADISGRFDYELERSKTDIGALEVSPK